VAEPKTFELDVAATQAGGAVSVGGGDGSRAWRRQQAGCRFVGQKRTECRGVGILIEKHHLLWRRGQRAQVLQGAVVGAGQRADVAAVDQCDLGPQRLSVGRRGAAVAVVDDDDPADDAAELTYQRGRLIRQPVDHQYGGGRCGDGIHGRIVV
jgi:hypothetical protein